ncbi:MAG: hypothetical protein GPJ51_09200 [Candidatus Heimdallarchaeota archaeon]|nr:hypothetical protein [Candidatus Heimdallarchaeota archaeon]
MDKEKYYKYMFLSGVLYNLGAGLLFGLLPIFIAGFLPAFGIENPPSLIFLHLVIVLVFGLAIAYFLAMKDLPKARSLALVGGISKILFFLTAVIYFILALTTPISGCSWAMVLILVPDLIQGSMFLEFFFKYDKFK